MKGAGCNAEGGREVFGGGKGAGCNAEGGREVLGGGKKKYRVSYGRWCEYCACTCVGILGCANLTLCGVSPDFDLR